MDEANGVSKGGEGPHRDGLLPPPGNNPAAPKQNSMTGGVGASGQSLGVVVSGEINKNGAETCGVEGSPLSVKKSEDTAKNEQLAKMSKVGGKLVSLVVIKDAKGGSERADFRLLKLCRTSDKSDESVKSGDRVISVFGSYGCGKMSPRGLVRKRSRWSTRNKNSRRSERTRFEARLRCLAYSGERKFRSPK